MEACAINPFTIEIIAGRNKIYFFFSLLKTVLTFLDMRKFFERKNAFLMSAVEGLLEEKCDPS